MQRGFSIVIVAVTVGVIALAGVVSNATLSSQHNGGNNKVATTSRSTSTAATNSSTSTESNPADYWQTYRNKKWGFEISYPAQFEHSFNVAVVDQRPIKIHPELTLANTDYKNFSVTAPGNIRIAINHPSEENYGGIRCEERERTVLINGKRVRKCFRNQYNSIPWEYMLEVNRGRRVFLLRCDTGSVVGPYSDSSTVPPEESQAIIDTCDDVFATLEIFPPSENLWPNDKKVRTTAIRTSNKTNVPISWQSYRNEELGVEMKYPSGWYVDKLNRKTLFLSNHSRKELSKFGPFEYPSDMNGFHLMSQPAAYGRESTLTKQVRSHKERNGHTVRELSNNHGMQVYEVFIDHHKSMVEKNHDPTEMLIGNQERYVILSNSWRTDGRSQELHDLDVKTMRKLAETLRLAPKEEQ